MNELANANASNLPMNPNETNQNMILPEEIRLPVVSLIQEKNHLIKQDEKRYRPGMIVDLKSGDVLSKRDEDGNYFINFIPISYKRVWICRNPREKGDKLFDRSLEANEIIFKTENHKDPRIAREEADAKENECNSRVRKYIQFLSYVEGCDMPVIISFGRSSRVAGETLLTRLIFAANRKANPVAFYKRKFRLSTVSTQWKEFEFYSFKFEQTNDPTDDELSIVEDWNSTIASRDYQADVDESVVDPEE